MVPFLIQKNAIVEDFKAKFTEQYWPAGNFTYIARIYAQLSKEQTDALCEWLATNCKENFYVREVESKRLAGGCTNNLADWQQRHKKSVYSKYDVEHKIEIRLSEVDVMLFRMVWVPDNY